MKPVLTLFFIALFSSVFGTSILIPMDDSQKNHLKAYGIAYHTLTREVAVDWLLNYRSGSFLIDYSRDIESECKIRGVTYELKNDAEVNSILNLISSPAQNMNLIRMEKAPRVAVYSPKGDLIQDETDAVILVLNFAEIPYDIIYDEEIINDALVKYDWLHLHHEDFTGQINKGVYRQSAIIESKLNQIRATNLGYEKVSQMKFDVVKRIEAFLAGGGYLFAMCSGAETFDIALAVEGKDIEDSFYDGGSIFLDFEKSLAFENFDLLSPDDRSFSDINVGRGWGGSDNGYFTLYDFSAKWDIIPSLLTQNHENVIREFTGLTTAFNKTLVKPTVQVLAESKTKPEVRYIYGELGKGHWTYYSGHDPEGSRSRGGGRGGSRTTDLNLYPNSPGYRLILNNVLFPSASKKKRKT
ncbi:MAG: asparagine synthetase B [Flammeovirgaceae bacterium]|nr:asparagine synthetase B [Flammeovirgaceae bacterium]